jgi:hypothetical protein
MLLIVVFFASAAVADDNCVTKAEAKAKKCNIECSKKFNTWSDPDPVAELECVEKCDAALEKKVEKCEAKSQPNKNSKGG